VSALPQVDFPTVQVTTQLPGASPRRGGIVITAPLERQLGQIPSLFVDAVDDFVRRQPDFAAVRFNRDIDGAHPGRQAAINAGRRHLARTLPYPPTYAKVESG